MIKIFCLVAFSIINATMSAGVLSLPIQCKILNNDVLFYTSLALCCLISCISGSVLWYIQYQVYLNNKDYYNQSKAQTSFLSVLLHICKSSSSNVSFKILGLIFICIIVLSSVATLVVYTSILKTNIDELLISLPNISDYTFNCICIFIVFGVTHVIAFVKLENFIYISIFSILTFLFLLITIFFHQTDKPQTQASRLPAQHIDMGTNLGTVAISFVNILFAFTMQSTLITNMDLFLKYDCTHTNNNSKSANSNNYTLYIGYACINTAMVVVFFYYALFTYVANEKMGYLLHEAHIFHDFDDDNLLVRLSRALYVIEILVSLPLFLLFVSNEIVSLSTYVKTSNSTTEKQNSEHVNCKHHQFAIHKTATLLSVGSIAVTWIIIKTSATYDDVMKTLGSASSISVMFSLPCLLLCGILAKENLWKCIWFIVLMSISSMAAVIYIVYAFA